MSKGLSFKSSVFMSPPPEIVFSSDRRFLWRELKSNVPLQHPRSPYMGGTIIPGITGHEKRERERMRVRHGIVWFHLSCNNPQASGEHVLFKRYEQMRQFSCATVNLAQREKERERGRLK